MSSARRDAVADEGRRSFAETWLRRLGVFVVFALATTGILAVVLWCESAKQWWAEALSTYVVGLLMVGGGIGAYAGWAFDEVDDPREERGLAVKVVLLWLLIPLALVLGRHVLNVPFNLAPGQWPWWADIAARVVVSAPGLGLAIALMVLLRRRTHHMTDGAAFWSTGMMFLLTLLLVALWPWMGASFPVCGRIVLLLVFLSMAILFAKGIKRGAVSSS